MIKFTRCMIGDVKEEADNQIILFIGSVTTEFA